mmetsp:Transcript_16794/g.57496  ORF Transcript_16794/g.57496 Transcript_16794/m.57496 type:complete len:307 (-) Transcript_16794:27-947(-)
MSTDVAGPKSDSPTQFRAATRYHHRAWAAGGTSTRSARPPKTSTARLRACHFAVGASVRRSQAYVSIAAPFSGGASQRTWTATMGFVCLEALDEATRSCAGRRRTTFKTGAPGASGASGCVVKRTARSCSVPYAGKAASVPRAARRMALRVAAVRRKMHEYVVAGLRPSTAAMSAGAFSPPSSAPPSSRTTTPRPSLVDSESQPCRSSGAPTFSATRRSAALRPRCAARANAHSRTTGGGSLGFSTGTARAMASIAAVAAAAARSSSLARTSASRQTCLIKRRTLAPRPRAWICAAACSRATKPCC